MDGTQEMFALGLCNIGGSLVRSMPVTGSFTRTAVNNSSGVKTTFGGLFTGKCVCMCVCTYDFSNKRYKCLTDNMYHQERKER